MIFFVHHPFIGQLILQKSKLIFQRRKVCDCRKPKFLKKCKISRLTHSKKTKMQLSWWSFKPSTWVTKFPAASLVISAINREKFEEWSEWFKSSKISTFAQVTSFYLHFSQNMYICVRNFVIEGVACQPPSSLRRLQATPPLQTSLHMCRCTETTVSFLDFFTQFTL